MPSAEPVDSLKFSSSNTHYWAYNVAPSSIPNGLTGQFNPRSERDLWVQVAERSTVLMQRLSHCELKEYRWSQSAGGHESEEMTAGKLEA